MSLSRHLLVRLALLAGRDDGGSGRWPPAPSHHAGSSLHGLGIHPRLGPPARASRVRLTTDGHKVYQHVVEGAFGPTLAMPIKMYEGNSGEDEEPSSVTARLSARDCATGLREQTITAALDSLTRLASPG